MSIKDFFMSYLTPFYLMYRVGMMILAVMLMIMGNGIIASKAGLTGWDIDVYIYGLVTALILFGFFRHHIWWLYLWIPILLLAVAFEMAESNYTLSMAVVSSIAFLLLINAFRFWNYGVSLNDINQALKKYTEK